MPNKIEMQPGKIYFIRYGQTEIVGRYKDKDTCNYNFYDLLHYWNGFESFRKDTFCVKHGIDEMREATLAEKHTLLRFSLEHNTI